MFATLEHWQQTARGAAQALGTRLLCLLIALALPVLPALAQTGPVAQTDLLDQEASRLYEQGRYAEAIPKAREALGLREQALGPNHPDLATSLNNLAFLLKLTADYGAAKPLYERVLAIRERALGPEHPDVAQALNSLALLLHATGDYARARPLHERALSMYAKGT